MNDKTILDRVCDAIVEVIQEICIILGILIFFGILVAPIFKPLICEKYNKEYCFSNAERRRKLDLKIGIITVFLWTICLFAWGMLICSWIWWNEWPAG